MTYLWNASTTIRNSTRIPDFLQTATQINGFPWNHQTQIRYQILLIQNRFYSPKKYHPCMNANPLTYQDAETIFYHQDYVDPPMRGRTSLNPLTKLGFVEINNGFVNITSNGWTFLQNGATLTSAMLEWSFTYNGAEIRPFIVLLHFLSRLRNNHCIHSITSNEFAMFVMTINNINEINNNINNLLLLRSNPQHQFPLNHVYNIYNLNDYLDNNLRYLRQSPLLSINRGSISLNIANINLINCIVNTYNGSSNQAII